ncbi:type VII secretion system-associated protein [Streptomyces kunmingensis]|uniref:Type VII secretion system-associated protein n=1 Tax=Streptomyces kunmingensis TaxID=68225 RepID=A0ABU6CD98_9ACTN|nr:type VII secretion system-associated protein [Streptomyces kunmingensis]MEB3962340.1 type VII secretion system-associated protein [Streptomyces kunmingensis]
MADNGPTLNLNKAWLQNFLTDDVGGFLTVLKKMREDGTDVPAIPNLQGGEDGANKAMGFKDGQKTPLAIGTMALDKEGRTNGGYLIKSLNTLVDQVDEILKLQVELFEEIEDNLEDTIEEIFTTQEDNLGKIDGKKIVNFFEGVDDVLSESGGGSKSKDEDEDED